MCLDLLSQMAPFRVNMVQAASDQAPSYELSKWGTVLNDRHLKPIALSL